MGSASEVIVVSYTYVRREHLAQDKRLRGLSKGANDTSWVGKSTLQSMGISSISGLSKRSEASTRPESRVQGAS